MGEFFRGVPSPCLSRKAGHSWAGLDIKALKTKRYTAWYTANTDPGIQCVSHLRLLILPTSGLGQEPRVIASFFHSRLITWAICYGVNSLDETSLRRGQTSLDILPHSDPALHPI